MVIAILGDPPREGCEQKDTAFYWVWLGKTADPQPFYKHGAVHGRQRDKPWDEEYPGICGLYEHDKHWLMLCRSCIEKLGIIW